jgi:glutamyl-tRNA synthetase
MPLALLEPTVTKAIIAAGMATEETLASRHDWYLTLIDLLRVRSRVIDDIVRQAIPYFTDRIEYDPEAVEKQWKDRPGAAEILKATAVTLTSVAKWDEMSLEAALRGLATLQGVVAGKIFQPLRVALTGLTVSPGIFDVLIMLGRDQTLKRLRNAVEFLTNS